MMTTSSFVYGVGLLYVVMFLGLSFLRRERLSNQFVVESLCITGIAFAAVRWGGASLHPIYFFIVLYLLTMRVRLLIEIGNVFSRGGRYQSAMALYRFAMRLFPDRQSRMVAFINIGATCLKQGAPEKAIEVLGSAKEEIHRILGPKYAAGCSYNLGMAYRRCGRYAEALRQFHEVEDLYPLSDYASLAGKATTATREEAGMTTRPPEGG
jgi:tetratricopeptide (TPR) repeat protein